MKFPVKITKKRKTGNLGEALVAKYLKNKAFLILGRNYLLPYGEVDVIAEKEGVIHFIEVKAVTCEISEEGVSREIGWNPADRVDRGKLRRVGKAAEAYLAQMKLSDMDWQLDVAIVKIDPEHKRASVELLENQSLES